MSPSPRCEACGRFARPRFVVEVWRVEFAQGRRDVFDVPASLRLCARCAKVELARDPAAEVRDE